ncbi:hypothetical protein ARMGADRAFT_1079334 [Armillaria gallica]|uniref:F-box domain-containing protein n=1 Tax=Armillaria gallica TaxID=47427 RepID=A0A2H3DXL2_ARMGA|nr:hypothetical protein ARMGADRAFT_1079334 [Armillaria gallica]
MTELNDDVLDLIFDEVCREEASMVEVLGNVSGGFSELIQRIADQTVVIDDQDAYDRGDDITPEEALSLFGKGDKETERKRLRARTLRWSAYRVRVDVLAQVLATLERVTALTFVGAKLDERTDGIPCYTTIREVTFEQCTLGFPGLTSLMQALPNLEGLKVAGRGTTIVPTTAYFPDAEPALSLPASLISLDMDCSHVWDRAEYRHFWGGWAGEDGNRLLYWLQDAANLRALKIAMTGEVGWYPGDTIIQASRTSLLSLTLALEHPLEVWDFYLEVEAPELLDLMVSARSAPTDLFHVGAFLNKLESPKLKSATFHIHALPISDDYPLCETVHHLESLAICIIRQSAYNNLQQVLIHWHTSSFRDTDAVELYSAAFSTAFEAMAPASHCGMKLVMEKTKYNREMF